ncbi:MAG: glycoside hydrolase family 15 protein [Candidatus Roizmanbacteria bacterium]
MARSIALGNGSTLVLLDKHGHLKDFYFPYVGLENQVGGNFLHRVGIYVDGILHWLDNPAWDVHIEMKSETNASYITAKNRILNITLHIEDVVYNEKDIFIRKISVTNNSDHKRVVKLFMNQQFQIYESHRGDTAYYDPKRHVIIHYKGRRVFLVNMVSDDVLFDDYTVGIFGIEGKEGSHKDAEIDGLLQKNPIEHGLVDSVLGITLDLESNQERVCHYWVAASKSIRTLNDLNEYVLTRTPTRLVQTTEDFWKAWVNKQNFSFYGLDKSIVDLFKRSLLIIRSQSDSHGAILASGDSDMLQGGRDTYAYMWPRDSSLTTMALDKAGDTSLAKSFFNFCNTLVTEEGFLLHKYRPDGSLGSSWHPWIKDGKPELPIQEDETALVIIALWNHYEINRDIEFIEEIYNSFIKRSAEFMASYIDEKTGLPRPSYDLWEMYWAVHTYTASTVYGALTVAGRFAGILGKHESEEKYNTTAEKLRRGILKYLHNEKEGGFYKSLYVNGDQMTIDSTLDASSIYGPFRYGILHTDDPRMKDAMKRLERELWIKTDVGGVARYQNDTYYKVADSVPGNPWFICTLWLTQYYISTAKTEADFDIVRKHLSWVEKYSQDSGVLSEQLHPYSGEQLSASPLTWSHAEFVITVIEYLEKLEELGISKARFQSFG